MRQDQIRAAFRALRSWAAGQPPGVIRGASHRVDPFGALVACVLSQRTRDRVTEAAASRLLARAADPASLARLGPARVDRLISPVGFHERKARSLVRASRLLIDVHGGRVPDRLDALLDLPGVGRKTAAYVLSVGHGKPAICVDTHVHRIANRWGYVRTNSPDETERELMRRLPKRHWIETNALLVPFGQRICRPRDPLCAECRLRPMCDRVSVASSDAG